MIDLSKDINPFFPTKKMVYFLKKNILNIKYYPNKNMLSFDSKKINGYFDNDNIVITNGTLYAMDLILKTYNKKIIGIFDPTFWGIKKVSTINKYNIIEEKICINDKYNIKQIESLAKKVDVLYLCNYNNPTLNYIPSDQLIDVVRNNKTCMFIIDETILSFDKDYEKKTITKYINDCSNLSVIISLSKIMGIAGLRAGLLIIPKQMKESIINNQIPYSINTLSQKYVKKYINVLFDSKELDYSKIKINKNFNYFIKKVDKVIVKKIIYNNSAFLLMEISDKVDYYDFVEYLLDNGVKVSVTNKYYNLDKKYIKVSSGRKKDYKLLIKLIKKYRRKI